MKSSSKTFSIFFFFFFFILGVYPISKNENVNLYFISIAIIILILGLIDSPLLRPITYIWIKFGDFLGRFLSPIVMFFIYFFVVYLTKIILFFFKKDILNLKIDSDNKINTYWIKINKKTRSSMDRQF
jgi:hypothetical protein